MIDECQFTLTGKTSSYSPASLIYGYGGNLSINGFFQRMDNYLARFEGFIQDIEQSAQRQARELKTAQENQGQPFPHQARLETLRRDNREVLHELQIMQKNPAYKSTWKPSTPDMAGEPVKAAAKDSTLPHKKAPDPAVTYIQVGDRGGSPIFNDRRL